MREGRGHLWGERVVGRRRSVVAVFIASLGRRLTPGSPPDLRAAARDPGISLADLKCNILPPSGLVVRLKTHVRHARHTPDHRSKPTADCGRIRVDGALRPVLLLNTFIWISYLGAQ